MTDPTAPEPLTPTTAQVDPSGAPPEINEPVVPETDPPIDPGDDRPYDR